MNNNCLYSNTQLRAHTEQNKARIEKSPARPAAQQQLTAATAKAMHMTPAPARNQQHNDDEQQRST